MAWVARGVPQLVRMNVPDSGREAGLVDSLVDAGAGYGAGRGR